MCSSDLLGKILRCYEGRQLLTIHQSPITNYHLRLPVDTVWVAIEGGNHAQLGWCGAQSGGHPATISREEQQEQIVQATVDFLASLKEEAYDGTPTV